jgi:hypothetical protein
MVKNWVFILYPYALVTFSQAQAFCTRTGAQLAPLTQSESVGGSGARWVRRSSSGAAAQGQEERRAGDLGG